MTDAQLRLECLRVAASLQVHRSTHLPSNLVPGIIADARSFADFVLGDDEPVADEPLSHPANGIVVAACALIDDMPKLGLHHPRQIRDLEAAVNRWRSWVRGEPLPDIDVTIKGSFPDFTGGFRDGPASEP